MPAKAGRARRPACACRAGAARAASSVLRRRLTRDLAIEERDESGQLRPRFTEVEEDVRLYEHAVLVTSLDAEILTIAGLYRDRALCENNFDELKNHWGWGGLTTSDLRRCRITAGMTALV